MDLHKFLKHGTVCCHSISEMCHDIQYFVHCENVLKCRKNVTHCLSNITFLVKLQEMVKYHCKEETVN